MKAIINSLIFLVLSVTALGQKSEPFIAEKFTHQLQLIDSIRSFINTDLNLSIPHDFYTDWAKGADSMYVYLYASRSNRIEPADTNHKSLWLWSREDSARAKSDEFIKAGAQTLLYKTAGTSDARLSHKLLSYPDEAIAFIVFHEATHNTLRLRCPSVPYNGVSEEALCDVVANEACLRFSAKTKMIYYKAVLQQKKVFEAIYAFMNQKRIEVEATPLPAAKKTIFQSCNKKISQLTLHANQFQKDRMCYPVNNAYFLRIAPYALHYFEIQNSMNGGIDMDKGTAKMLAIAGIALQPQLTIPKDNLHWSWSAADTLK